MSIVPSLAAGGEAPDRSPKWSSYRPIIGTDAERAYVHTNQYQIVESAYVAERSTMLPHDSSECRTLIQSFEEQVLSSISLDMVVILSPNERDIFKTDLPL